MLCHLHRLPLLLNHMDFITSCYLGVVRLNRLLYAGDDQPKIRRRAASAPATQAREGVSLQKPEMVK
jgi:hypothetical protein